MIKLLLKELEPTEGTILVDGKKLGSVKHKQIPKYRRNIGVVFQDFRLLKDRNVYDNVAFAQKVVGETNSHIRKKVPMMLSMVGLAAKYRSASLNMFSLKRSKPAFSLMPEDEYFRPASFSRVAGVGQSHFQQHLARQG